MPKRKDTMKSLILSGSYTEAHQLFGALQRPLPEDMRWEGVALLHLGRTMEARTALLAAQSKGCPAAAIELAGVLRYLGEPERAVQILKQIDLDQLDPFDRALALRERGVLEFAFGRLRPAYAALECAWEAALQSDNEQALLPGIALSLAYTCLLLGSEKRTVYFLNFALPLANPQRRQELLIIRAACELYNGAFADSLTTFELAKHDVIGTVPATLLYFEGLLHRYKGLSEQALQLFDASIRISKETDVPETECYAALGAATACMDLGNLKQADRYLTRAAAIPVLPKVLGMVKLRQGNALRSLNAEAARTRLDEAIDIFSGLDMHRELAWTYLHLAEVCLVLGDKKGAMQAIDQVMCSRAAIGDSKSVALELRGLPEVSRFIQQTGNDAALLWRDWQDIDGVTGIELRVSTLGTASLHLDQKYLRPNASLLKTVELLSYFERKGEVPLHKALADVFPDRHEKSARMHFHLIRQELERLVPGLAIVFDRQQRFYRLRSDAIRVRMDSAEVLQHLNIPGIQGISQALAIYSGPFLQESESEWVEEERTKLEWLIVKVGLETLEDYYEKGEDKLCLDLATKLLDVAPLNEGIHELLIRATGRLRGAVAARQVAQQSSQQFLQEVGEVPPVILRLQQNLSA